MSTPSQRALVVVLSNIRRDPRVQREIDWLTSEGWVVDSLGLGEAPPGVREHFRIAELPAWTRSRIGKGLLHALLTNRAKFHLWGSGRFPAAVSDRVRAGEYELVIVNDIELLPWIADMHSFTRDVQPHLHLDLHEYFPPSLPKGSLLRFRVESYFQWTRSFIGHPRVTSRSVVATGIADLYVNELGIPRPGLIRNCPPYEDLNPGAVDPQKVELVHHGGATWVRGLREIVDAMRLLDERFVMTFLLTGSPEVISELKEYSRDLGDRIRILPPVPMSQIAQKINQFDLEIMFYPPVTENLLLALPNKLFEAIQARLGLVIGESPMMAEIVAQHENGKIIHGWSANDLAAGVGSLSAEDVARMKEASHGQAHEFSAEHERGEFMRVIGIDEADNGDAPPEA